MADTRAAFLKALEKVQPRIREAFEAAILDIRSASQAKAIEEALSRGIASGDVARAVQEVIDLIPHGREYFAPLDRAIQEAFFGGADFQIGNLPKPPASVGPLNIRFDGRHPLAEAWTREAAAHLITEIAADLAVTIRETILEGMEAGRGVRSLVRDLIGRTEGNKRVGGLIGLHSSQAQAVRAAMAELEALDASYFRRARRDARFDGTVRKAIREGKPLSRADIDRITARYSDRLLAQRGERIARTESNRAMNEGRRQGMAQVIERGEVPADVVTKVWKATPSKRTRDTHWALNDQEVGFDQPFTSPSGAQMMHPHDTSLGAPGSETINCRCSVHYGVDWAKLAR